MLVTPKTGMSARWRGLCVKFLGQHVWLFPYGCNGFLVIMVIIVLDAKKNQRKNKLSKHRTFVKKWWEKVQAAILFLFWVSGLI
jgi:hypothetical protein